VVPDVAVKILVMTLVCQACLYAHDMYEFRTLARLSDVLARALRAIGATAVVFAALYVFMPAVSSATACHDLGRARDPGRHELAAGVRLGVAPAVPRERLLFVGVSPRRPSS
jgi:hypothetical protein